MTPEDRDHLEEERLTSRGLIIGAGAGVVLGIALVAGTSLGASVITPVAVLCPGIGWLAGGWIAQERRRQRQ